jgi:hypothetical protein
MTIFYEYQTGNSIFPVHGNELVNISAKVRFRNNIHGTQTSVPVHNKWTMAYWATTRHRFFPGKSKAVTLRAKEAKGRSGGVPPPCANFLEARWRCTAKFTHSPLHSWRMKPRHRIDTTSASSKARHDALEKRKIFAAVWNQITIARFPRQ